MKKVYLFLKSTTVLTLSSFLLLSSSSFGQETSCGGIAQDFNNTSGGTAGFIGDFKLGLNGSNSYLEKNNVIVSGLYTITTPTYTLPAIANSIGFGFLLDGSQRVARVEAAVMYVSTLTNEMTTVFIAEFAPSYGTGTSTAEVCRTVSLSELPGFPAGGSYRFRLELTPNAGSGLATERIIFDNWRTNGTFSAIPLPVNFIGFEAKKQNNTVQLTWKVAGEENVARYDVERSQDGHNFSPIASVNVHGKDTYNYTDAVSSNLLYYRIKNVDNDGKFKYSTIARIANGRSEIVLKAFPQPAQHLLTLQHPVINGRALISLSTADGRIVRSVVPADGSMQTTVDMSTLQKGMYLLRFDAGNGEVRTLKVLKQ